MELNKVQLLREVSMEVQEAIKEILLADMTRDQQVEWLYRLILNEKIQYAHMILEELAK